MKTVNNSQKGEIETDPFQRILDLWYSIFDMSPEEVMRIQKEKKERKLLEISQSSNERYGKSEGLKK